MWHDLFAAVALMLVFEGIMPFVDPQRFRISLQRAAQLGDLTLRGAGLLAMVVGVIVLYAVR